MNVKVKSEKCTDGGLHGDDGQHGHEGDDANERESAHVENTVRDTRKTNEQGEKEDFQSTTQEITTFQMINWSRDILSSTNAVNLCVVFANTKRITRSITPLIKKRRKNRIEFTLTWLSFTQILLN